MREGEPNTPPIASHKDHGVKSQRERNVTITRSNPKTTTAMAGDTAYTGAATITDLLTMPLSEDNTIVEYIWIDGTM